MGSRRLRSVSAAMALLLVIVRAAQPRPAPRRRRRPRCRRPSSSSTPTPGRCSRSRTHARSARRRARSSCMTALIAVQRLKPGDAVPISPLAEGMPARKINVKAGQVWTFRRPAALDDDGVGQRRRRRDRGEDRRRQPRRLREHRRRDGRHVSGSPTSRSSTTPPASTTSSPTRAGARISPRDLAIVSRAVLARPDLVNVINTPHYEFTGGDGIGHTLNNHDLFLDLYPGANGLKTGTTDLAGHTFVGSATPRRSHDAGDRVRRGRLLRLGRRRCSTRASTRRSRPRRTSTICRRSCRTRRCRRRRRTGPTAAPVCPRRSGCGRRRRGRRRPSCFNSPVVAVLVLVVGLAGLVALRRRTVVRRRRALVPRPARQRGPGAQLDLDGVPDEAGVASPGRERARPGRACRCGR